MTIQFSDRVPKSDRDPVGDILKVAEEWIKIGIERLGSAIKEAIEANQNSRVIEQV